MAEAIQAEHLAYAYPGAEGGPGISVFRDLNLKIEEGTFVAVLGRNGCGKSTLAKHCNAIALPEGGTVTVFGMDTQDEGNLIPIRRTVGMVFQNPDNQIVANVVEEDVAFAPENLGVPPLEIRKRVDEALKAVDMYEYREHAPHKLSGGQKQRVAIAGIIAMETRCIVLDEPTAMLDPRGRAEVMETLHTLNREHGITVVLITHYMDEAVQCDRVVVVDSGSILLDGSPREVFSQVQLLKQHQLDVPQSTELTHRLKAAGVELPECTLSIDECVAALESLRPEFSHAGAGGEGEGGAEHAAD